MTVSAAALAYESARQANLAAQAAATKAAADVDAAKANIDATKAANARSIQEANGAYFAAVDIQQSVIERAHLAQIAESEADIAVRQAILDSRQGNTEIIPPNQTGANTIAALGVRR